VCVLEFSGGGRRGFAVYIPNKSYSNVLGQSPGAPELPWLHGFRLEGVLIVGVAFFSFFFFHFSFLAGCLRLRAETDSD